jgi:hypothetical protein
MKSFQILFLICICGISHSCDDLGIETHHSIPYEGKFLFRVNDTLTFQCGDKIQKFDIPYLVNGKYYEYRSGTCMKGSVDIIDFQAIFIKPVDSIAPPVYISETVYDCYGPPQVNTQYICIIKNLVNTLHSQGIAYDASICWYSDFIGLESSFRSYNESITLNNKKYNCVYTCDLSENPNSGIDLLYYTMHYGFIGYKLKNGDVYNLVDPEMKYYGVNEN